jgi:Beta-ketoacyl synthase, N-terminal domain
MLRRRCSPLSRIVLTAAFACLEGDEPASVRTVFASRHGSVNESLELLEHIVAKERLSPAKFSHTVHNAQAGLFCIAAGNRHGSSSLAARADTFACGYVEALAHIQREPSRRVLYVMGDRRLAPTFADLVEEPPGSYAVALLLGRESSGPELRLEPLATERAPARPWPDAVEFLRWVRSDEPGLQLGRFRWTRV